MVRLHRTIGTPTLFGLFERFHLSLLQCPSQEAFDFLYVLSLVKIPPSLPGTHRRHIISLPPGSLPLLLFLFSRVALTLW